MWQGEWVKKTPLPSTHSPNHDTARHLAGPAVDCGRSEGAWQSVVAALISRCSWWQAFGSYFLLVRGVHQWPESLSELVSVS